ncbi:MAG: hypothetical protein IPL53_14655 [Ignavibacteria bacterium]|nr:hypothetical protein [Ignavibacteria bacterium]
MRLLIIYSKVLLTVLGSNGKYRTLPRCFQMQPIDFTSRNLRFNQIPCMAYVSRKINSFDGENNFGLMCDFNYSTFKIHIPHFDTVRTSAEYVKRTLIDSLGIKEIFMGLGILSDSVKWT